MRDPLSEKTQISSKIKLEIDDDSAFDYAAGVSHKFTSEDYLKIILREVDQVHQMRIRSLSNMNIEKQ